MVPARADFQRALRGRHDCSKLHESKSSVLNRTDHAADAGRHAGRLHPWRQIRSACRSDRSRADGGWIPCSGRKRRHFRSRWANGGLHLVLALCSRSDRVVRPADDAEPVYVREAPWRECSFRLSAGVPGRRGLAGPFGAFP
ncbi:hypothetical protein D3C73_1248870 [compost metagenome]